MQFPRFTIARERKVSFIFVSVKREIYFRVLLAFIFSAASRTQMQQWRYFVNCNAINVTRGNNPKDPRARVLFMRIGVYAFRQSQDFYSGNVWLLASKNTWLTLLYKFWPMRYAMIFEHSYSKFLHHTILLLVLLLVLLIYFFFLVPRCTNPLCSTLTTK